MNAQELKQSATAESAPPTGLSPEVEALWHTKAGNWDQAHDIAQDIHTQTGSWIHALLHLIEGDVGNAGYWFRQAGRPARSTDETDELWHEIAQELLS